MGGGDRTAGHRGGGPAWGPLALATRAWLWRWLRFGKICAGGGGWAARRGPGRRAPYGRPLATPGTCGCHGRVGPGQLGGGERGPCSGGGFPLGRARSAQTLLSGVAFHAARAGPWDGWVGLDPAGPARNLGRGLAPPHASGPAPPGGQPALRTAGGGGALSAARGTWGGISPHGISPAERAEVVCPAWADPRDCRNRPCEIHGPPRWGGASPSRAGGVLTTPAPPGKFRLPQGLLLGWPARGGGPASDGRHPRTGKGFPGAAQNFLWFGGFLTDP